jgi:hypothetical protein
MGNRKMGNQENRKTEAGNGNRENGKLERAKTGERENGRTGTRGKQKTEKLESDPIRACPSPIHRLTDLRPEGEETSWTIQRTRRRPRNCP